ncbi:hypothetical protein B4923_06785 [Brenneria roseae subsp. americana]|uniref:Uncharacterized protein n=1 Tax=Brenneria roseae subsp. americana TaxID=1508507 RepID=A0A2U1TW55_9GAMM|nr:hypothetical protein B4923_06785 [Brenneria roseae subsp. americana]
MQNNLEENFINNWLHSHTHSCSNPNGFFKSFIATDSLSAISPCRSIFWQGSAFCPPAILQPMMADQKHVITAPPISCALAGNRQKKALHHRCTNRE